MGKDYALTSSPRVRQQIAFLLFGITALAAVILVAVNSSEIGSFAAQAARAEPIWLILAFLSQILTYFCDAAAWKIVLHRLGSSLTMLKLLPLSVAKLFADQAIPSAGVSGGAFFLYALGRRNVPQEAAFSVFAFVSLAFLFAFLASAMVSFFSIADGGDVGSDLVDSIATFAAIILFGVLAIISFLLFQPRKPPKWLAKIPAGERGFELIAAAAENIKSNPLLFLKTSLIQLTERILDGVTLWLAIYAVDGSASFYLCFIAVVLASVAATIAPIPMGLGSFEGGMIATLTAAGVDVENALTATLIYRGLSLWLPLLPGFFIIQREMLRIKSDPAV
ncbi:lysylphosphatidylglycerol synthase transmembrane domain-containing protein [Hyphococcus sp. DH-69]|uniref:lysylphosphatidylglycerol synthase transmembrane domain-containing protein n=1 Tax=Hyphococcus formosus TaxID=3143534 RepID=UPI00398AFDFE